jgi:hypothetical protein
MSKHNNNNNKTRQGDSIQTSRVSDLDTAGRVKLLCGEAGYICIHCIHVQRRQGFGPAAAAAIGTVSAAGPAQQDMLAISSVSVPVQAMALQRKDSGSQGCEKAMNLRGALRSFTCRKVKQEW